MFCNLAAENRFRAHNLNLEGYKIKSTLAYKIFSTLLLHRRWERRYRVIVFLARRYLQIENEGWGLT